MPCNRLEGQCDPQEKTRFSTQKETQERARNSLSKAKANANILFVDFFELYFEDLSHRLKGIHTCKQTLNCRPKNNACV